MYTYIYIYIYMVAPPPAPLIAGNKKFTYMFPDASWFFMRVRCHFWF